MAVSTFDTLRIANALKDAGFDDEQAKAIVVAIQDSLGENLVTKSEHAAGLSDMKLAIAELRADMHRSFWVLGGALVMIMVALFTLFELL